MPLFFFGHGDPMNALRTNDYSRTLNRLGASLKDRPRAILMVSAHWLTKGTWFCSSQEPQTIHDFGGFPDELYQVRYPAPGHPELAQEAMTLVPDAGTEPDWGLDHGAWSVLTHLFPEADIPVFQMSIDYHRALPWHLETGTYLKKLRNEGVLIIGSGNVVHNLRETMHNMNAPAFDWNLAFNDWVVERFMAGDHKALTHPEVLGQTARLAVPTPDHYIPLLSVLGAAGSGDEERSIIHQDTLSGLSMLSLQLGT